MNDILKIILGLALGAALIGLQTYLGQNEKMCYAQTRSGLLIAWWKC